MNGKSNLFNWCADMTRAQADLYRRHPSMPHRADRLWSELTMLHSEVTQLRNQLEAKERRMLAINDQLKKMAAARDLPGLVTES